MATLRTLPSRQRGLSLVELMIAVTIGLLMLTAMASMYMGASRSNKELARSSRQIEDGRYALQTLTEDLSVAGYLGYFTSPVAPGSLPDPCEMTTMATIRTGVQLAVQGYDSPATIPSPLSGCLDDADHVAGTDVLVVRRADTNVTATGLLLANEVYIQTNSDVNNTSNPVIAAGTLANFPLLMKDNATLAPIRKLHVHIYYVAPCSVPKGGGSICAGDGTDDNGSPIPTLKRKELTLDSGGNRAWVVTPIAEGVENLQIDYGVDGDGDGVPDTTTFTTVPASAVDWANVVVMNLHLLVRNTERTQGYSDPKTYNLGLAGSVSSTATGGTLDAGFKRKAYAAQARIVNTASRRETP
jgi:type IV pilus assembly protein PilW